MGLLLERGFVPARITYFAPRMGMEATFGEEQNETLWRYSSSSETAEHSKHE